MIRNVYLNGKINTLLVVEDEAVEYSVNPLFEAIKQQAERIELLEEQNRSLIKQEEILLSILELSTRASNETDYIEEDTYEKNVENVETVFDEQK
ncbi:MAG: hypothetical protein GY760_12170 [Deltaproteobacteria bacterium]|nr:hypothetical protein [Deltaproteobacteria bacterium]